MERRNWIGLIGLCILVAPITFTFGRWSGTTRAPLQAQQQKRASQGQNPEKPRSFSQTTDFTNVKIENLGDVEFDHAYELLRSAPREALEVWTRRLEGLPVGPRRTAGLNAFFKTLAEIDARKAVHLALSMDRYDQRWTAIGAIRSATPATDLPEVARMFTALNEKKLGVFDLISNWSRSDPAHTAEFISNYAGEVENDDIAALMENWAALDPGAAEEWLARASPNRQVEGIYAGFYAGWVEHDRDAALTDLVARAGDEKFKNAIEAITANLFAESPDSARDFILKLPAGAVREAAVDKIAGHFRTIYMGGRQPDLKADEVTKWLLTLPDGLWQEEIGTIAHRWRNQDEGTFSSWLNQLSLPKRDTVLARYCRAFDSDEPTEGFEAGFRINDPKIREETFREIFREMDEERREEILGKVHLPPAEASELTRFLKPL